MMLEGKYLLGLPIDLRDKKIGVVHQPKYKDLVENDISLNELLKPFLMKKEMLKGENDEFNDIFEKLGDYGCLFVIDENNKELNVIENLIKTLKLLYNTEDVHVNPKTSYIHINQNIENEVYETIIDIDTFKILSDLVYEMCKIDKPKVEDRSEMTELDLEIERLRNKNKKKTKNKKKGNVTELHDVINYIIHSNEFNGGYKEIGEMTIYQIKNTYETLGAKSEFENYMEHKLNGFDVSKMKFVDWRTKKIVKNSELFTVDIK